MSWRSRRPARPPRIEPGAGPAADPIAPPEAPARPWRDGIEPVALQDLKRLGRDAQNRLYWDGKLIRTTFKLTFPQQLIAALAVLASVATVFTGLNNASVFLCARDVHWLGCPSTALPPAAPTSPVTSPVTAPRLPVRPAPDVRLSPG